MFAHGTALKSEINDRFVLISRIVCYKANCTPAWQLLNQLDTNILYAILYQITHTNKLANDIWSPQLSCYYLLLGYWVSVSVRRGIGAKSYRDWVTEISHMKVKTQPLNPMLF